MAIAPRSRSIAQLLVALAAMWPPLAGANIISGIGDEGRSNPDGRDSILKVGPQFGLSAADIDRVRSAAGYVFCKVVDKDGKVHTLKGSGFLAGANDVLVTSGHELRETVSMGGEAALDTCYFRPQFVRDGRTEKVMFVLKPGNHFLGIQPATGVVSTQDDVALITLMRPITGAEALPLTAGAPPAGTPILKVSASEQDMDDRVDYREPIATICEVRELFPDGLASFADGTAEVSPGGFYSDCDAKEQASGGASLAWFGEGADRHLEIVGITIGTGFSQYDGSAFDEVNSHTYHFGVSGYVRIFARRLAMGYPVPTYLAK